MTTHEEQNVVDVAPGPPRRLPVWLIALLCSVVAVVATVLVTLALVGGDDGSAAAPATTSARPVYQPVQYTEQEACIILVPMLEDAVSLLHQLADDRDGSTIDRNELAATLKSLRDHVDSVPVSMRDDVRVQIETLRQVENLTLGNSHNVDFGKASASGVAIGSRCRQYAR